jgi:glycosyltransferase involved in cell wall biosynthesis
MRKKVLWIGDAVKHTGFARITHNVVDRLVAAGGLDVSVLGVNYYGDAAARHYPYDIHPVTLGGDAFGLGILPATIQRVRPDVIVINNDPWIVAEFLIVTRKMGVPLIGYLPVDAPSMKRARDLNGLACAVWYTRFGQAEAEREGYVGPSAIIPHAVDLAQYFPVDRLEARRLLKLPIAPDAFVVGNVNRNSRRKRLDITVRAFAAWWHAAGRPSDAHLFLHCANADDGADLAALGRGA